MDLARPSQRANERSFRTGLLHRILRDGDSYEGARFAIERAAALVYLAAFASLAAQVGPLFGRGGLLPIALFMTRVRASLGAEAALRLPSLFWATGASDSLLAAGASVGVLLSLAALFGVSNAGVWLALWLIYGSYVHVGQIFFAYGWETQLLETGMLVVMLSPWRTMAPWAGGASRLVVWLFRWLIVRVMLGSALIKLRGDPCWRELTCLDFHFETQPNPNPLAFYFHHAPHGVHAAAALFTLGIELVVPLFVPLFAPVRWAAGALLVSLQLALIVSGNLSFLNWLTIVPALACFDDRFFAWVLGRFGRGAETRAAAWAAAARARADAANTLAPSPWDWVRRGYALLVALLSVPVIVNLASPDQEMNRSYEPLDLVGTYGAFGSVDRERTEVVVEGSDDPRAEPGSFHEYDLPCMPGDVRRAPCIITPFHLRLDWQMWFVGNGALRGNSVEDEPWLVHFVWQLLRGEPSASRLLATAPLRGQPPRFVRLSLYRFHFASGDAARGGAWWTRERMGDFLPPVSLAHAGLRAYVRDAGWDDSP